MEQLEALTAAFANFAWGTPLLILLVGGGLLGVMLIGISRGAFSNEAGLGTEVMAHGAAKTNEPIREGLVGMLGLSIPCWFVPVPHC
jgi:AGCS family alanine or glycine:cation symporter